MRQTPNYNLPQFDGTDKFNKEALNDAFNKIDDGISELQDSINVLEPTAIEHIKTLSDKITKSEELITKNEQLVANGGLVTQAEKREITSSLEQKTNQTTTNSIQEQVTNLVLGAVGDGNNPEVVQSRVNSIGLNHLTVFDRLKNDEYALKTGYYNLAYTNIGYSVGGINLDTGKNYTSTSYVRSNGYTALYSGAKLKLKANSNYRIMVIEYNTGDGNFTLTKHSSWITSEVEYVLTYGYFRILISNIDTSVIVDISIVSNIIIEIEAYKKDRSIKEFNLNNNKKYIAHAGLSINKSICGKNSLRSIEMAKRAGFDFCEMDFRKTSDGIIVAMHDSTINDTCCNNDGSNITESISIANITYNTLITNYKLKANLEKDREKVPTLEECLKKAKELDITIMIEPKFHEESFVNEIINKANSIFGLYKWVLVANNTSINYALSKDMNTYCMPVITTLSDIDYYSQFKNIIMGVSYSSSIYSDLVSYAHKLGYEVESTLDNVEFYNNLINYGADIINYDFCSPAKFKEYTILLEKESINNFGDFITEGVNNDGILTLSVGQTITINNSNTIYFGTMEVEFEFIGDVTLKMISTTVSGRLTSSDYRRVYCARTVYNNVGNFTITANTECKIKNLKYRLAKH